MNRLMIIGLVAILISSDAHSESLHRAMMYGDIESVQKVIESDPSQLLRRNSSGNTALHSSAAAYGLKNNELKALLLIDKMTPQQISMQNGYEQTPLYLAASNQNELIVEALLKKMTQDKMALTDVVGQTALHRAAMSGNQKIAQMLVNANQNLLHIRRDDGKAAADIAREKGHEELAQILNPERMIKGDM